MQLPKSVQDTFSAIVGAEHALFSEEQLESYRRSSLSPDPVAVAGVLLPASEAEVLRIVSTANMHAVKLYPLSVGNNLGYGSRTPASPGCLIVDLSRMKRIRSFDATLGSITVEPGVRVSDVESFLNDRSADFLSPVIGAGPDCSMIGNMLEKGTSHSPHIDRFGSLVALRAVLPDGSMYSSYPDIPEKGAYFKWGVGPYLDGLFAQSNLGIVTAATFLLAPRPSASEGFFISLSSSEALGACLGALRALARKLPGTLLSFRIENPYHSYVHYTPYTGANHPVSRAEVEKRLGLLSLSGWTCMGAIAGEAGVVSAARRIVQSAMREQGLKASFYSESMLRIKTDAALFLPTQGLRERFIPLRMLRLFLDRVLGRNERFNSWFPAWKYLSKNAGLWGRRVGSNIDVDLEPSTGFLYFTAVLPFADSLPDLLRKMEDACLERELEPVLLVALGSAAHLTCALQIIFQKDDAEAASNACTCYEELFRIVVQGGGVVHRLPHQFQKLLAKESGLFWPLAETIKGAVDPKGLLSPGRYLG